MDVFNIYEHLEFITHNYYQKYKIYKMFRIYQTKSKIINKIYKIFRFYHTKSKIVKKIYNNFIIDRINKAKLNNYKKDYIITYMLNKTKHKRDMNSGNNKRDVNYTRNKNKISKKS